MRRLRCPFPLLHHWHLGGSFLSYCRRLAEGVSEIHLGERAAKAPGGAGFGFTHSLFLLWFILRYPIFRRKRGTYCVYFDGQPDTSTSGSGSRIAHVCFVWVIYAVNHFRHHHARTHAYTVMGHTTLGSERTRN